MPNQDRTGPQGQGSGTGKGMGRCRSASNSENNAQDNNDQYPVRRRLRLSGSQNTGNGRRKQGNR